MFYALYLMLNVFNVREKNEINRKFAVRHHQQHDREILMKKKVELLFQMGM